MVGTVIPSQEDYTVLHLYDEHKKNHLPFKLQETHTYSPHFYRPNNQMTLPLITAQKTHFRHMNLLLYSCSNKLFAVKLNLLH